MSIRHPRENLFQEKGKGKGKGKRRIVSVPGFMRRRRKTGERRRRGETQK
jgi:hypothetical protein